MCMRGDEYPATDNSIKRVGDEKSPLQSASSAVEDRLDSWSFPSGIFP